MLKKILNKLKNSKNTNLSDIMIIKQSMFFNAEWYLETYKDVKNAKMNPALHYLKYGWKEYRDPSPIFSTNQYLIANPDVKKANINPLIHFEKYGKKENRKIFCNTDILQNNTSLQLIDKSQLFDHKWYSNYYYFAATPTTAVKNYMNRYQSYNPSPLFYSKEYLLIYPDVQLNKMNPLVHYEKYGKYEGRAISLADLKKYKAPADCISINKDFFKRNSFNKKIVTVVASFSGNGKIEEYVQYLLEGIKAISDYIIFVTDNPIYQDDINKLSNLCNVILCERHGEYDFGSYKRGYNYLIENNILNSDDDLIFINDSCYGPIYPFENVIEHYKKQECDFYGLSVGRDFQEYIQSFFYIFKRKVYNSQPFNSFINNIKKELSPGGVIINYEFKFTEYLSDNGFIYSTYIDKNILPRIHPLVPTKYPLTLIQQYRYPLIKRKAFSGQALENMKDVIDIIKNNNIKIYHIITQDDTTNKSSNTKKIYIPSKYNIYRDYDIRVKELQQKIKHNQKIKAIYLINMASMFPAEQLMLEMQKNSLFECELYVIPDTRFGDKEMYEALNKTYSELSSKYVNTKLAVKLNDSKDQILEWFDVVDGADIVCYPSPYDVSYSLYNPYYAVQKNILSIHINYGFFRSKYDRIIYNMDNYSNFWKVFLETDINYDEYKKYGQCRAENAVTIGYAKMDRLINYKYKNDDKIKIIIAPHHSVDGGTNKMLSLSNFEKYADYFLELPKKYPNIEFIFRPHPVLFTILKRNTHWGEEKVKQYLKEFTSYSNVIYSTDGDYLEVFADSDGIIQDSGSFLVEYFYTMKPCCYMLKSPNDIEEKFNDLGKACLEHTYIAYKENDIDNFIENVIINKQDTMKEARERFAKEMVMQNYPNVSKKILEYIENTLKGENND